MAEKEKPQRGLPAIREARELRASRPWPAASGKFWLWSLIAISAITVFYWKKTSDDNDRTRARILAKQRQIAKDAGPMFYPLRDRIEAWTMQIAKDNWDHDIVEPELGGGAKGDPPIFKRPGVYLRVSRPNAVSKEKIREAAQGSLRDAFTACLLKVPHLDAHKGKECKKSRECELGQICNEVSVCAVPTQPYNLRVAYRGMRPLDETWVRDVETASEELRLRLRETEIDEANASDIPVAIDLLKRAQYFLLVIDDVPEGTKPEDGGTIEQAVQSDVHPTRVAMFDLASGKMLLRVKRTIDVSIPVVPGAIEAQRRQVLNCALAQDVRDTIAQLRRHAGTQARGHARQDRRAQRTARSPASAMWAPKTPRQPSVNR